MKDSVAIPQGLRNRIPFDPTISLLGIHSKDYKLFYYKDICTGMFIVALFTIVKTCNQLKSLSMIDCTKKMCHIHSMEYYAAKKMMSSFLCRDMDKSGNHHSQQNDTRTENQTPHVLTHRRVLTNENTWTQGGEHHTLVSVGRK